ncbi:MAG: glutathione peroxidase [Candidatus Hydrogenedentota bacterium]
MSNIDGEAVNLAQYQGQVVLIVNVASKCGFTPQYEGLEALYRQYKDNGFVILGFPANNFMGQEPGTNAEIKTFCSTKYDVTFPMFAKISVKGKDMAPLYQDLVSEEYSGKHSGTIKWNFTKFLVGRDGIVRARFGSRTKPLDPKIVRAIETALEEPRS